MLTDTAIRNLKPKEAAYKVSDGGGMYLLVSPKGGKWWRYKYRFEGDEKCLSLGVYPDISLKDARGLRDEARKLLAKGTDPSENRKALKSANADRAANSFEVVAREWYAKHSPGWAPDHAQRVLRLFERDIFPRIGGRPVADVPAPDLLAMLRRIENREALDTAHRARSNCGQVFRYAIATGRAQRDPSADLRGALPPATGGHFAAVTEPKLLGELLRKLDAYQGTPVVMAALRLAPLVFVRPKELRTAEWSAIHWNTTDWRYTAGKTQTPHIVPLASQALAILRELQPLTGNGRYLFPCERGAGRPMSDNAILAAMRSMGITREVMTTHGFRATARTLLEEELCFDGHIIEQQLAHAVPDPNGRAYNRTAFLDQRRKMMQVWADYLDKLKADVGEFPIQVKTASSAG